ncbi:MAG: hypothetical protein JXR07_20455 [Reichenbachiella sp.]
MALSLIYEPSEFALVRNVQGFSYSCDDPTTEVLQFELWIENDLNSAEFEFAFFSYVRQDENGHFRFEINKRLQAYLSLITPDPQDQDLQIVDGLIRKYKLKYREVQEDDLEIISQVYHSDKNGEFPYLNTIVLDEDVLDGGKYQIEAITSDADKAESIQFVDSEGNTFDYHEYTKKGGIHHITNLVAGLNQDYSSIIIPADVLVTVRSNDKAYHESDIYYAWLAGGKAKQITEEFTLTDESDNIISDTDDNSLISVQ